MISQTNVGTPPEQSQSKRLDMAYRGQESRHTLGIRHVLSFDDPGFL